MTKPNSCNNCRFATWDRKSNGTLHPSGAGHCDWPMPEIPIPAAYYYIGNMTMKKIPKPTGGGYIHRQTPREGCPCWSGKYSFSEGAGHD